MEFGGIRQPRRVASKPSIAATIAFLKIFESSAHPSAQCPRSNDCRSKTLRKREGTKMKNIAKLCLITLVAAFGILAAENPMVGGHEMFPTKNIVQNAVNSEDHTTLVAAVKAAGLVDTLESPGPFTVFAPTNEAFEKLPAGTVETLLKPENKAMLTKVLTYHVVAGKLGTKELAKAIKDGHGTAHLKTVSGGMLTASMRGNDILVMDEK